MGSLFGGGGDKKIKLPKAPNLGEGYKKGVNLQLQYLPKQLEAEALARGMTDAQRIKAQQHLQQQFGTRQSQQQLQALERLAPGYMQRYKQLGALSSKMAKTPTLYENLAAKSAKTPSQYERLASHEATTYSPYEQQALAASRTPSAYEQHALEDLNAGYGLTPGLSEEVTNTIRGRQALSGNVMGNAPIAAEAAFTGSAMNEMYQQRMANAQQAELDRQARMAGAGQAEQMKLARMGTAATAEGIHQARLGGAAQAAGVQQQRLGNLSSFLAGANPAQQVQGIAPISPDRTFAYVNPNAGYLGLQAQQQNYSNALGAAGLQQSGQGGGFPWGQLLSTAGTVAAAFSDRRLKKNVSRVGQAPSGLNIYKYQMKHNNARMIGAMADDVERKQPDAVITDPSGTKMVDYGRVDVPLRRIA